MINNVDLDGDKVVNFQEFIKMMDYETVTFFPQIALLEIRIFFPIDLNGR